MGRQLAVDGGVAPAAVLQRIAGLGIDRDDVHERVRALEVGEERVPEPDAVGRALEQPGDVRDRQLALAVQLDGAEVRRERRERVVRDLGRGVRDAAQQRRLAGVREAEQRGVADHLEPQLELGRLAVLADLRGARRLAHGRREAPVAAPSAAAAGDHDAGPGVREVGDGHLAARVEDLRAERHVHDGVLPAPARSCPCPGRARRAGRAGAGGSGRPRGRACRDRRAGRHRRRRRRRRRRARPWARTSRAGTRRSRRRRARPARPPSRDRRSRPRRSRGRSC